jgi:hypothetical protein
MIDRISNFSSSATAPHTVQSIQSSDYEHLRFHIASDDYFPYLSALLSFIEESLGEADGSQENLRIQLEAVKATRKDLRYLHDRYCIAPRA